MNEVKLIPADHSQLFHLVYFAFDGDSDLIDKYQAEKRTHAQLVNYVHSEITSTMLNPVFKGDVHLYAIVIDEETAVGYCALIINEGKPHMLFSYGINIAYRKKEILTGWLKAVGEILGDTYYTCNWNENTRSIAFLEKNNFAILRNPEKPFIYAVKGDPSLIKKHLLCL